MNVGEVSITALVVITVVGAVKDFYPKLTGNGTRLVALVVGGGLGYLAGAGILPIPNLDLVSGAIAGVAAVGAHSVATKMGGD